MYIANSSHLLKDFDDVQEFGLKKKSNFIGKSRRKVKSYTKFFLHYVSHRILVRRQESDEVIGYAEFSHFPKIDALPRECWMDWLKFHYCCDKYLSEGNILFLNYFLYCPEYNPELFVTILREIFFRELMKRYILIVELPEEKPKEGSRPEDYPNYDFLRGFTRILYPRVYNIKHCKNTQKIHIIYREQIISKMTYRLALPEDNDEIVAAIDADRPDLRKEFGDFYIAEELLRHQEKKDDCSCFIVNEVDYKTMGFIWLNKNVDIEKLIYNFELEIFGNLVKFNPSHKHIGNRAIRTTGVRYREKGSIFTETAIKNILKFADIEVYEPKHSFAASSRSIHSNSKLVISSTQGIITINPSAERFFIQSDLLQILKNIHVALRDANYYAQQYGKSFIFNYNITGEGDLAEIESNAFCLQLFAITPSFDKRRLHRFLATSFSAYPDRDYCILSIPKAAKMTNSLYQILKYFVMVVPRPNCKIHDYLFVTHRSSVFGEITVASIREEDVDAIDNMIYMGKNMRRRITRFSLGTVSKQEFTSEPEMVKKIISEVLTNILSEYTVLTIRCGDSSKPVDDNVIVGFVILRRFQNLHLLSDHFIIPKSHPYYNFVRSEVVFLKLQPLYHTQSDQIFREIGRQTDTYDFYYFAPNTFSHKRVTNDLVIKMQPVEPIPIKKNYKYIKTCDADLDAGSHVLDLDLVNDNFSVFNINMKPTQYFGNNNTLIILGFSNECKAFLRQFLFNWNKTDSKTSHCCVPLAKIIVIVKPGIDAAEYDRDLRCSTCEDQNDCWINYSNFNEYLRDTVERIDFRVWVKFVNAIVKNIDRKKNHIIFENKCELYYDTLVICTAKHFGIQTSLTESELPHNYAHINNRFDKCLMYHKIRYIREAKIPVKIIVYGSHIRAFEFIDFLLKHGMDAKWIALVIPFHLNERELHQTYNITYADLNIEFILEQMVEDLGVKCYDRMNFIRWKCDFCDNSISHVMFESFPEKTPLTLDCDLFVNYYEYYKLDADVFNLLSKAGIELSEHLVLVDDNYRTNDPNIFALGQIIQRRVQPNYQYSHVSSVDAANKLVQILGFNLEPEKDVGARYRRPTYFQAKLPMGYYFVKVTLPKLYISHHLSNEYSTRLVTYKNYTFCRIRLNEHSIVEEFVCVTQQRIPFDFLIHFVGKHQALLNDLQSRWFIKEIDCFLEFFQEPWAELIMHRKFHVFRAAVKDLCMETAEDIMLVHADITRDERKKVMKCYLTDLGTTKEVEETFLRYLRKYRSEFSTDLIALPEDFLEKQS